MKTTSLYVLNLAPAMWNGFFDNTVLPEDLDVKIYKTFPRFLKGLQMEGVESPRILLFLPSGKLDPAKTRQLRLTQIDSPMYVITSECTEKDYLSFLSMGMNGIITPPFSKADVHGVLGDNHKMCVPFPRNNELIKEGQVRLDFLVPSKLSRILGVNRLVSFLAAEFGFPPEDWRVNLPMVIDEALSNAIEHGNKGNESLKVHVRIYISSRRIVINIEDQGEGFIPESVDDPTDQENIYKGSGRGIFLMKELMDSVSFKNGGRLLEIEKINSLAD
ncbi:MAG: ATP-binding protein [Candidatus Krumholzibacteria bacterium]|nr:ATP-binding protein [Candidatus Krumholzibacteria bacterium]